MVTFATLAKKVGVAATTVQSWVQTLQECYYCFLIRPWSHNVIRSLLKEPKVYLMDWSDMTDPGAKKENFVVSHLLKAVQFWTDTGQGKCELYFVRDKEKRAVDFLVVKNKEPWFLVEVKKSGNQSISEHLYYFHQMLKTQHAFQVAVDLEYQHVDCFTYLEPVIVPAATFLSQLC